MTDARDPADAAPPPASPSPPPPPHPPRRRRWVRWALAASVCVNLLLIGAAAGAFLRHGGPPRPPMPAGFDRVSLWHAFREMAPEERDAARTALKARREQMRRLGDALAETRGGIADALAARPFSPEALAAALNAAREAERASGGLSDAVFVDLAGRLTDHSRQEIAEALREARGRGRWDRDDDRGPPRPPRED
ncbi:MAG: periplasmic heavy metal sensor [Pseudomonadota bacterium]|nr:periplasmic heavy metal sensor [Pseudomonadota bacterium]